jgi:hypothetical protein
MAKLGLTRGGVIAGWAFLVSPIKQLAQVQGSGPVSYLYGRIFLLARCYLVVFELKLLGFPCIFFEKKRGSPRILYFFKLS